MSEVSDLKEGIAVVACLDMIASDVIKTTPNEADRAIEVYYNQLLFKIVEKVDESDGKLAVGVVAPLFWTPLTKEAKRSMNHTYKLMMKSPLQNVWFTEYMKDVNAGADGTHSDERLQVHQEHSGPVHQDRVGYRTWTCSAGRCRATAPSWSGGQLG